MIPRRYIEEWKAFAPWPDNAQIEQDLVIERALVEIFSDDFIKANLAFRGGTALHKLFMKPQARYSEDIDLVQISEGPIGTVVEAIRKKLSFLSAKPTLKHKANNTTLIFKFESETPPIINLKLKVEINCREHFNVLGVNEMPFSVTNSWFTGNCNIKTYQLEELLGTKLRALYQRSKGRDLFDLYWAFTHQSIDKQQLIKCYREYMHFVVVKPPTIKQFLLNMEEKMKDKDFEADIFAILRPGIAYDHVEAFEFVKAELLEHL